MALADKAPVPNVPLVGCAPLQAPEAVQDAALVEVHVSVELPPAASDCGSAIRLMVGTGTTATVTAATGLAPPAPVQVSAYAVLIVSVPVTWVPLVGWAPAHPPEAVQDVAFMEFHVSVALPPTATACGAAVRSTVAAGTMATVTLAGVLVPPGPLQVME